MPAALTFRNPTAEDGLAIWQLVRESRVLDVNSPYSYLLLCRQFGDTCVVAERAGRIVGFVTAFRPPRQDDVIFVWQVGVDASERGRGVAGRLLEHLLRLPACRDVRFLETTVTPNNGPSQALFRSLARRHETRCEVTEGFPAALFGDGEHEAEELYRIGPMQAATPVAASA